MDIFHFFTVAHQKVRARQEIEKQNTPIDFPLLPPRLAVTGKPTVADTFVTELVRKMLTTT